MKKILLASLLLFIAGYTFSQTPELWGMTAQGGIQDYGVIFKINGDGTGYFKVHDFGVKNVGAAPPSQSMIEYNGWLYGVCSFGGMKGVIFKYHPADYQYKIVHYFKGDGSEGTGATGSLLIAANGKMYGVTEHGGNYDGGVLYEFDPVIEHLSVKHSFVENAFVPSTSLVEGPDSNLYGCTREYTATTLGSLFRYNMTTDSVTVLHHFTFPMEGESSEFCFGTDGKIYGNTSFGGAANTGILYSLNPSDGAFTILHSFDPANGDGVHPYGKPMQLADGRLIGVTADGGPLYHGSFYQYNPVDQTFLTLYFLGSNGEPLWTPAPLHFLNDDGWIYGCSQTADYYNNILNSVYRFNPTTLVCEKLASFTPENFQANFSQPNSGFIKYDDGLLYSLTGNGGNSYNGTIYSFNPVTSELEKQLDLNETICTNPLGNLTFVNGNIYGYGGNQETFYSEPSIDHPMAGGQVAIFKIDPLTGTFQKTGIGSSDFLGYSLSNSLTAGTDQKIYGIAASPVGQGAQLFSLDPATDSTSSVYVDKFSIGPVYGNLVEANNHKLYGMSVNGGISSNQSGLIFKVNPADLAFSKVFDFEEDSTGNAPHGSLVKGANGLLYGMTKNLSTNSPVIGVIFSFDPQTETYTKLYEFTDSVNGKYPLGSLIQATDGNFYGMTPQGGMFGYGVIFRFDPNTNQYTKLFDFDGALAGGFPNGDLYQASNGKLYGMTVTGGLNTKGVIFAFDPVFQLYEVIENFTVNDKGALPYGSLIEVHTPASIIYQTPDTVACLGSEFEIQAIASGGYLYHTWYHDGIVVGSNSKSIMITNVTYADTGKYWCNIHNDLGSTVSDTIHLQVITAPSVSLTIAGDTVLCPYDDVVELTGSPAGGFYSGPAVFSNYFFPGDAPAGLNKIEYTWNYGCTIIDSQFITVNPVPELSINGPATTTFCLDDPAFALSGSPSGGTFSGDGVTTGNAFDPTVAGIGSHVIYYTYTDFCTATDSIQFNVEICTSVSPVPSFDFEVNPNPFTDVLTVHVPVSLVAEKAVFKLTDGLGNVVKQGTVSSPLFHVKREGLSAGLYLFTIESATSTARKKVVVE